MSRGSCVYAVYMLPAGEVLGYEFDFKQRLPPLVDPALAWFEFDPLEQWIRRDAFSSAML